MTVFVRSEDVAEEIATRLSTISIANGFETDIGRDVQRGRRKVPSDDEPPCCQLVEVNDEVMDAAGRTQVSLVKVSQPFVIDAFDACDSNNPNVQAHKMIRDIKRVLFKGGRTLGGKASEVVYMGKDIGPRPDGASLVQARVVIKVSFVEDLANP